MWVFLAWTTTENWFKVCWPLLKMKSTTSQTVFHVTREVVHNLFSLRAQRDTFPLEDWLATEWIISACIHSPLLRHIKTTLIVKKISPALTFRTWWFVHLDILYTLKEERRKQAIKEGKCISIGMTHIFTSEISPFWVGAGGMNIYISCPLWSFQTNFLLLKQ